MAGMTNSQTDSSAHSKIAVLLHAFPLDAGMWAEQKRALEAAGFTAMVPHLPGFGGEAGELSSLTAEAERLVDGVLPAEPVVLVGLSMGGYLALEVLAVLQQRGQPERVSHLVLADTHARGDDAEQRQDREQQAQKVLQEGQEFMVEKAREEQKPTTAEQTARMTRAASREGIAAALRAMAARADRRDVLRRAGEQGLSVLAVVGSEDKLTPPEQARENADLSGGELKVIESAGHLSNLDEPEAFNEALVGFLTK